MEKKVYGRKPSYQYLRSYIKKYNNREHAGEVYHITSLVYYAIKHDLTEEQAIEYFHKEMDNCEKLLKHHSYGIYFKIPYADVKDLFNVDLNDFVLHQYKGYDYDFSTSKYNIDSLNITHNYSYKFPKDSHNKLFRDYNEHSAYLYDLMDKHGYCNHIISFDKYYDGDNKCDTLYVTFSESYNAAGNCSLEILKKYKEEYAKKCLDFWHFIKLFDYSEHPNDIDINEYYKRKETIDEVHDNTIWQMQRIKLADQYEKRLEMQPTKIYRWNPIIKNIEEVKDKIKSLLK